jgi:hypothetical protein
LRLKLFILEDLQSESILLIRDKIIIRQLYIVGIEPQSQRCKAHALTTVVYFFSQNGCWQYGPSSHGSDNQTKDRRSFCFTSCCVSPYWG